MTNRERMTTPDPYVVDGRQMPAKSQQRAKKLCWQLNQMDPDVGEARHKILMQLFGTVTNTTFVEAGFHCDYGFNIHFHGLALLNYNVTILDTSPVHIGAGTFIAPGVVLACSGHAMLGEQRAEGVMTSAPITLADNVRLGANVVVTGGVTIGAGSIIGAGSVVNHDIPAGVVAVGSPCRVLREVTEADRVAVTPGMSD